MDDLKDMTQRLADSLRERGHTEPAGRLSNLLSTTENAFLQALKVTCDTLLTAVEALDPVSEMELERLRRGVDELLEPPPAPPPE